MEHIKLGKTHSLTNYNAVPGEKSEIYFPSITFDPSGAKIPKKRFRITFEARVCKHVDDMKEGKETVEIDLLAVVNIESIGSAEPKKESSTDDEIDKLAEVELKKGAKEDDGSDDASDEEYMSDVEKS